MNCNSLSCLWRPLMDVCYLVYRKLRTKSAVDEQAMVEQIGDSSLIDAVYRKSSGSHR